MMKMTNKIQLKSILLDIRFWIIIFFILRLIGITNAPLEIGHNWRQSLTNMIARNFLETRANILYPMIDMAGEKSGIIGSEFPFFNYLIYIVNYIFDYSHWAGRLINLIVSSTGIYFFYKLIKSLLNKQCAFNASIILTVSIWFSFSRKIMPDTFSVSLVIIGLYYAYNYLKNGVISSLVFFFIFSTLGMLCKIPSSSLFCVLSIIIFIKKVNNQKKIVLFIAGSLSMITVYIWYFYWVPYLLNTYHFQLYFPKGIFEGIQEIIPLIPELLEKFYFSSLNSYIALVCFVFGIIALVKSKRKELILGVTIITTVFFVFIVKTGAVFPLRNYYIIPFTPVMALLTGYAISKIPLKFQYLLLGLISLEGIANQQHDFFIKESKQYKLELEDITQKLISPKELIIINGGPSPQDIYFSHRKGWTVDNADAMNDQVIDSLTNLGAKYLIIDKSKNDMKGDTYQSIYDGDNYSIFRLTK